MCKHFTLFILGIFFSLSSFSQFGPPTNPIPISEFTVEVEAKYPGGLNAFYQFLQRELKYPWEARATNIEGKLFVEFIVTSSGYIDPNSVKTIQGLHPSLDREAERVIKLITVSWVPGNNNGIAVAQRFIVPISFELDQMKITATPLQPVKRDIEPVKTIIVEKSVKVNNPLWAVFKTSDLSQEVGRLMPGDSVDVIGWGPWSYQVKNITVNGFVSWKAVKVVPALDSIATVVAAQSVAEEKKDSITRENTYQQIKPNAHLNVIASKKEVYVGECLNFNLAFNVARENRVRLQFVDLGEQVYKNMLPLFLVDSLNLVTSNSIENVVGVEIQINHEAFTSYSILNVSACPQEANNILLKKIPLYMARIKQGNNEISRLETFESKPLVVKVKPLPPGLKITPLAEGSMVGKFTMKESLEPTDIKVGTPVEYKVMIEGPVSTNLLEPPKINLENCITEVKNIISYDTVIQGENRNQKTFVYLLTFTKEGSFDLSNKIELHFFEPKTTSIGTLRSTTKGFVLKDDQPQTAQNHAFINRRQNLILLDGSQSMMIEDYAPNRLNMVKAGLAEFLTGYTDCNTSMITFGATAKYVLISSHDSCYSNLRIKAIDFNLEKRGTAIGDAIWFALTTLSETQAPHKIIVIGDGDNTAGWLAPDKAAVYAKRRNVSIYTIGVGHQGLVKFGVDFLGKPLMVDNTFSDKDLKEIASITGGKYYWAKDEAAITRIIDEIFKQ